MIKKSQALGRLPQGVMNKTESAYAEYLEALKIGGAVLWYAFEPVTFRLAKKTSYTPDFLVMLNDMTLECHEVKGFWQDDARVKVKVAADQFPFLKFVAIRKIKGGWDFEEF